MSYFDIATQGTKLLFGAATGASTVPEARGEAEKKVIAEDDRSDFDEEDESDEQEYESDDEEVEYDENGMALLLDDSEEEEEEDPDADSDDEDDGVFAHGLDLAGLGAKQIADRIARRRKTFLCDIHSIRLTNLSNRRRDVQVRRHAHEVVTRVCGAAGGAHTHGPADRHSGPPPHRLAALPPDRCPHLVGGYDAVSRDCALPCIAARRAHHPRVCCCALAHTGGLHPRRQPRRSRCQSGERARD